MTFLDANFLLPTPTARRLFHEHARHRPILDYHCHLSPRDIAEDRQYENLTEIWLAGDHYKWRAMRANGIEERFCTGDAAPFEKFRAWAETVPHTLGNPLFHWTHLELKRCFGIDALLTGRTAPEIWEQANARLKTPEMTARGLLRTFGVAALCTTDDPADDLRFHRALARSDCPARVFPTFRPDAALAVDRPPAFNAWVDRLAGAADTDVGGLPDFLAALDKRHRAFHEAGCRLSDHGLSRCPADFPNEETAAAIFARARAGRAAGPEEHARFAAFLMLFFGRLDAARGWTKQLHLGALRSANTRAFERLGPDTGFDSPGDGPQAVPLAAYLDRLDREGALPKMILYNANPADNVVFAALAGSFQVQYGAAWWFLDTKDGIERHLSDLANIGLLSRFIGMLTDSRSFLSFPRHEYFRRVLCRYVGRLVDGGELPDDDELLIPLLENICCGNAERFLGLDLGPGAAVPDGAE